MKIILRHSLLLAIVLFTFNYGQSAISSHTNFKTSVAQKEATVKHDKKSRWQIFKEKIGEGQQKIKERFHKWVAKTLISMPTGKLLTSLVLLLLSIIILAIGGVTKFGLLFGILGSIALVGALAFFLLWMAERSKSTPRGN